tara:strand:- start:2113 stop:2385 length:273 start_codon:yes stop_codon:yes gene_type:complete
MKIIKDAALPTKHRSKYTQVALDMEVGDCAVCKNRAEANALAIAIRRIPIYVTNDLNPRRTNLVGRYSTITRLQSDGTIKLWKTKGGDLL